MLVPIGCDTLPGCGSGACGFLGRSAVPSGRLTRQGAVQDGRPGVNLHADMTIKERALAGIPASANQTRPIPGARTTSSPSSNNYDHRPHRQGYSARTTGSRPAA